MFNKTMCMVFMFLGMSLGVIISDITFHVGYMNLVPILEGFFICCFLFLANKTNKATWQEFQLAMAKVKK